MIRTYGELIELPTFQERFQYLSLDGIVGARTFGGDRWLNQVLYHDSKWRAVRRKILERDKYCDLGCPGYEIHGRLLVHHMEPITKEDIMNRSEKLYDPDNLITVSANTHRAIHYGTEDLLPKDPVVRKPNDTCPWR